MSETDAQAALREMARSLGALESTVSGLVTQRRQQDEKASQGRRVLHQKNDALRQCPGVGRPVEGGESPTSLS